MPTHRPKPWYRKLVRTWMLEAAVVACILAVTTRASGGSRVEWIGSAAVFAGFLHAQVGFRFTEAAEGQADTRHEVECYYRMTYYFIAKEILWFAYFALLGAWSGLAGVAVFLSYPLWRKYYVSRRDH